MEGTLLGPIWTSRAHFFPGKILIAQPFLSILQSAVKRADDTHEFCECLPPFPPINRLMLSFRPVVLRFGRCMSLVSPMFIYTIIAYPLTRFPYRLYIVHYFIPVGPALPWPVIGGSEHARLTQRSSHFGLALRYPRSDVHSWERDRRSVSKILPLSSTRSSDCRIRRGRFTRGRHFV